MKMASSGPINVNRYGLTQVYSPTSAEVDVVFVHGLNGDPEKTWTSEGTKVFWPAQLLPPILEEEKARVLVYGYDADVTSFTDGASRDKIHNHAEHLIAELAANRRIRKATERPIIFVAHSLGGLVLKRALIYSSEIRGSKTEHLRSIFVSTYGILFLGTPHKGSDVAEWGSRLEWICSAVMPKKIVDSAPQLVDALKTNNETLQNIDRQFIQIMNRYHIYFFHEGKPTNLKGTLRFIVNEESASPTVQDVERAGIQADHSHMCKFESDSSPGFDLVAEGIQRYAEDASATIKTRWDSEHEERNAQLKAEAAVLYPDSMKPQGTPHSDSTSTFTQSPGKTQKALPAPGMESFLQAQYEVEEPDDEADGVSKSNSTTNLPLGDAALPPNAGSTQVVSDVPELPAQPAEPYFIVPPGFRKNTFFVAMDKELGEIDRRLFDKRRREGTACVLLHGQAGSGKSHLAREYVNRNRKKKFRGGIFWINAKLKEERYQAFWNIAQKVVARESPELRVAAQDSFVDAVRLWFEQRQEWLIVFDGIAVDKDEDTADLKKFIPYSRNSNIIYVSLARNLETKGRLLTPFPIRVSPLNEEDGRRLLFKELHIRIEKATEAEKRHATDLVRNMGGLPLAIHAISHRIAETHEPLATYKMKSYSADPKLGGTYHLIMDDLQSLNHMEAWNLINLLCFYGPHIPVVMVQFGVRCLRLYDIEVKSREDGAKPDLNITLGILMRYALIERNELEDRDSASGSRDSLVEPEPIDMLKMHTVVQKFCCDSLNAGNLLPRWLGYATKLFCYSYQQADFKIKQIPEPGRISDYREYLVHGQMLWDHSLSYESKKQQLEDIRTSLAPTLRMIKEEIRKREPGSSQESIGRGVFQMSIFDNWSTSSSSAFAEPEIRTPGYRPSPLPLPTQNVYGIDIGTPSIDSPRSLGTASPLVEPRIVDYDTQGQPSPLYYDDRLVKAGGPSPKSYSMQQSFSESTARPDLPIDNDQDDAIDDIPSSMKATPPRGRRNLRDLRDLGTFRPTPAKAEVNTRNAAGSVSRPPSRSRGQLSGSSDAVTSLSAVHRASPPPSRGGGSIWQRRPLSRPPAPVVPQRSYAEVAATAKEQSQYVKAVIPSPVPRQQAFQARSGNVQPSPLNSEHVPHRQDTQSAPNEGDPFTHPWTIHQDNHRASEPSARFHYSKYSPSSSQILPVPSQQQIHQEPNNTFYQRPSIHGPNPAPLPISESVTLTSKRPLPSSFQTYQPASDYPLPSPYPHPQLPSGYSSQPMSRDASQQSRSSAAFTEPLRPAPNFSPFAPSHLSTSPRDRLPDGAPPRKSPKFAFSPPSFHHDSPSPRDLNQDLSGTGGWAYSSSPASPTAMEMAMSRDGSSGPGVAFETGLGIGGAGRLVQFGELPPVSLEEARRRTREYEVWLREGVRGGEGGIGEEWEGREGVPYPSLNRIPTGGEERRFE